MGLDAVARIAELRAAVLLVASRWHGTHFASLGEAKPLMCRAGDGGVFSRLDHFKRIDADMSLGVMSGRNPLPHKGYHFYFLLEREP
jgi:hypothetical protein